MRFKILDRYLISEMAIPFIIGIVGFVLILIVDILFTMADLIINKGIPAFAVIKLVIFKLPAIMVLSFPVSTLFSTTMVFGRLCKDNEMVALRSSGISFGRIILPVIVFSILISFLSLATNEKIVPWTNRVSENIIRQVVLKQPLPDIKENVFFKDSSNRYFYVKRVHPKRNILEEIMIYEFQGDYLPRVIFAKRANFDGKSWKLLDGIIHSYDKNGRMLYEATFSEMAIYIDESIFNYPEQKSSHEMSSRELKSLIDTLGKSGINTRSLLVDFYMKFSIPFTCFVFALIGIPFSVTPVRSGRMYGIVVCIVTIFTFYVFASIFRSLGYGGKLDPFTSAWFPQISFAVLGIIFILRESITK